MPTVDKQELERMQADLIKLQRDAIDRIERERGDVAEVVHAIFKELGTDKWAFTLEEYEQLLFELLMGRKSKTHYRFRTFDVAVKYMSDKYADYDEIVENALREEAKNEQ